MNLLDIVHRQPIPESWAEGEKIPWHDPDFSARMLREHLSQAHDAASRRMATIDRQVDWIHDTVLGARTTVILDLGCGPGLYTMRFAGLGHECVGIDYSPASIAYARDRAAAGKLQCTYVLGDIRDTDYGGPYGLVMLIFGELNVFTPADARTILRKAHGSLGAEGILLLEPHTYGAVRAIGERSPSWYSADEGLFSAQPHICLRENFWDAEGAAATERYLIIDAGTGTATRHASTTQAYSHEQYRSLLAECGFVEVEMHASLLGEGEVSQPELFAVTARKA